MKLSIEQLSKLTKISVPTLRTYVARKNLGTKVGNSRVFSQADVQKLQKSAKGSNGGAKAKANTLKAKITKTSTKSKQQNKKETVKPKVLLKKIESPKAEPRKKGFWTSLFGGRKAKEKVSLLDVKNRKQ